jgi:hypothetical protein
MDWTVKPRSNWMVGWKPTMESASWQRSVRIQSESIEGMGVTEKVAW